MKARVFVGVIAMMLSASVFSAATAHASRRAGGDVERAPIVSVPDAEGDGVQAIGISYDFASIGYEFEEFFFEGEAVGYEQRGTFKRDGKWRVEEGDSAPFRTRMIVVRPTDPADFSGTVFVEWFNVTGGVDAGPTFLMGHNQILRSGGAWVGVTTQAVGVTGSEETVQSTDVAIPEGGLVNSDPARYGTLTHPGDLYSYDIFTQTAAAISGEGDGVDPMAGLDVERVIGMGQSQSAARLTTYVNAVHPLVGAYDGFLIHSRVTAPAPLGEGRADVVDSTIPDGARIRSDTDVPVFIFETEYDVIGGYAGARQPDSKNVRLWEVAGTSHIDAYTGGAYSITDLGDGAAELALLDPAKAGGGALGCAQPLNAGGQYVVLMAVMEHLESWVRDGTPPRRFPRLDVTGEGESIEAVRDELGIATGGVRTPLVDVPVAANTGYATNTPNFCRVMGVQEPFDGATIAELYPNGSQDYVGAFDKAVERAVKKGIWLEPEAKNYKAAAQQLSLEGAAG